MKSIEEKVSETTRHIADKILMLRRANKLTQEEFAEKVSLDRRTVARAEAGKHRPSAETIERIALTFSVPVCYFYDASVFRPDISKKALIYEINTHLNVMPKKELYNVKRFIDLIYR